MARPVSEGRLHGFVVVDKPASWTSHDVIAWMRRLLGERRIGHAGTLDPAATGVLPIGVGYATRLMEYLAETDKSYLATIQLGIETDSLDGDGRVTHVQDAQNVTRDRIEAALGGWRGPHLQVPPMHSAIKLQGKRLYEHARRGESFEREARPVTFHALQLLEWTAPEATIFVRCSKGTYIRALARDLGHALDTGAYLSGLVRCQTGPFCLHEAWTLRELDDMWREQGDWAWERVSEHPDSVLADWPAILLDHAAAGRWATGMTISGGPDQGAGCRAYGANGEWLGIGRWDGGSGQWQPTKVMAARG